MDIQIKNIANTDQMSELDDQEANVADSPYGNQHKADVPY